MLMYKVMRVKSDGMLYSINVNRRKPYNIDEWVTAEYILTKHYHDKKGFYGFEKPDVTKYKYKLQRGERRVWVECEVSDYEIVYYAPDQVNWVIAQKMKIIRALSKNDIADILAA